SPSRPCWRCSRMHAPTRCARLRLRVHGAALSCPRFLPPPRPASRRWSQTIRMPYSRPPGTPAPILTQLHDATVAVLALPEVRDQLREQGAEVVGNSAAELAAYVAAEIPKWAALARQAGVKPL